MRSGRPAKPATERRNKSAPVQDWVKLPKEGRKGKAPAIPQAIHLSAEGRKWWKSIWSTPMATMWMDADVHPLLELAVLRDKLLQGNHAVAGEVRIREADYGLTLTGRRALRWLLEEEADQMPEAPPTLASVHRLEAIDPSAVARS